MISTKHLKKYKKEIIIAPAFKMLEAFFDLLVPLVMASIIDVGIQNGDTGFIVQRCLILVVLGAVGLSCTLVAQYFSAKTATMFTADVKQELFSHIQTLSYKELDQLGTATMLTRLGSDANQVQTGLNLALRLLLRSPMIVFGALIMAFRINASISLIFAVSIIILTIIVFAIMLLTVPMYANVQSHLDGVTTKVRESIVGVRVIRAFNAQNHAKQQFNEENQLWLNAQQKVAGIAAMLNPFTYVVVNITIVALLYSGAIKINAGILTQGEMIALYNYMSQILVELIKLANLIITINKSLACLNRIEKVLQLQTSLKDGSQNIDRIDEIEFNHVSLKYNEGSQDSLTDISFTVKAGENVGVIGATGCGKTSLINLLGRYYDVHDGQILINHINIQELTISSLRERIALVPQKALLFKGTIESNLRWGNPQATFEQMNDALAKAQAFNIIESKGGLQSEVQQNGSNFSGGQKQRLCIARALVKNADVLILDDSTSALDYATEASLRKQLQNLENHPTVFIVSQRTSSIAHCDKIIVLDDGEMAGIGTHEELLRNCSVYQEIYYSQNKKEEE